MTSAEQRLKQRGTPVETEDFGRHDEPDVTGCVVLKPAKGGVIVRIVARPGVPPEDREMFAEWAESRIDRFLEHGPEPDGWQRRSDEAWQLWARRTIMPLLD